MRCEELSGKVAIVTGASRGIGKGVAQRLATEGARVVLAARGVEALEPTTEEIRAAGGDVLAIPTDVSSPEQVERLFAETVRHFGVPDIVVNNAGWALAIAHILEMDLDHWDIAIASHLRSVYLTSHRAANLMVDHRVRGTIINVSSMAAARSHRIMAAYDAAKGGVEAMSRTMAIDLAPFGIRVNVVGPGAIHTEDFEAYGPEAKALRAATVPLGRVGYPEDIAGAVVFLCSDDAAYVTGQILYVDGGMLAQLRSPQVDTPLPESVRARLA